MERLKILKDKVEAMSQAKSEDQVAEIVKK